MPTIIALILAKFRKGSERVASWLAREGYDSLFLDLPRDMENFLKTHMDGELSFEGLWRSYGHLTGFQKPFINALRYTIDPIVNALTRLRHRMPDLWIYCYQDLEHHMEAARLSERLLLLETKGRVSGRISVEEWRKLLRDEVECETSGFVKSVENIAEEAIDHSRNVVLYRGMVKPLKSYMEAKEFKVEALYLQHYWRSPLEVLRTIAWTQGVDNVSDDEIRRCVRYHLRYLDYVLSSEDIDGAHEKWILETLLTHRDQ